MKYVFVTGGVVSGLGKGIVAASLGRLLKENGYKVISQKLDPYLNISPSSMSPAQHGEVFVTEDGTETDLDLGHYERFINEDLNSLSSLTSGKIYDRVLANDKKGVYGGNTVQVIPHVTNEIKQAIYTVGKQIDADITIVEIGGTVGDIEGQPFLEAVRQVTNEAGLSNCIHIHVVLIPQIPGSGEHKTKPAQHSVKVLQGMGINPNVLVARVDRAMSVSDMKKLALFCNVDEDCIICNTNVENLYEVPVMLEDNGLYRAVSKHLGVTEKEGYLGDWVRMVEEMNLVNFGVKRKRKNTPKIPVPTVTIALVGQYVKLHDAYLSVAESLMHAGFVNNIRVNIVWVNSSKVTEETFDSLFAGCDGIIAPDMDETLADTVTEDGAQEGQILVCERAHKYNIPYLGIGAAMLLTIFTSASKTLSYKHTNVPILVHKYTSQKVGAIDLCITETSQLHNLYGCTEIRERVRESFTFSTEHLDILDSICNYRSDFDGASESINLSVTAKSIDGTVEAVEVCDKFFYIAVAYRPEYKSRPDKPHPLFVGFIDAAIKKAMQ